jgi:uncharacterized membrane protein
MTTRKLERLVVNNQLTTTSRSAILQTDQKSEGVMAAILVIFLILGFLAFKLFVAMAPFLLIFAGIAIVLLLLAWLKPWDWFDSKIV